MKKRKLYLLANNFHQTECHTKYSPEEQEDILYKIASGTASDAEKAARRRAWKKLCGHKDCTCASSWGEYK